LIKKIQYPPVQLSRAPDLFIQISIPSEFTPVGKYNIGITAGIETTLISPSWIDGCNRMNMIWTISEHSKQIILGTVREHKNSSTNEVISSQKVKVPVHVLPNCVHTDIYRKLHPDNIPTSVNTLLKSIPEKKCFLFVGHWLSGNIGEDRKNVGLLTHIFCEVFKKFPKLEKPALILKTSGAGFSLLDRENCLKKIRSIRSHHGELCPNVYLLHGDMSEEEMNGLYNHPKIKANVNFTHGEGFGRPLLEFTMTEKPTIASGWSGQLDFLDVNSAMLIGGKLEKIPQGSVQSDILIPESSWFNIDVQQAANALLWIFTEQYKTDSHKKSREKLANDNRVKFSYESVKQRTKNLIDMYCPNFPQVSIPDLPPLKKFPASFAKPTIIKKEELLKPSLES